MKKGTVVELGSTRQCERMRFITAAVSRDETRLAICHLNVCDVEEQWAHDMGGKRWMIATDGRRLCGVLLDSVFSAELPENGLYRIHCINRWKWLFWQPDSDTLSYPKWREIEQQGGRVFTPSPLKDWQSHRELNYAVLVRDHGSLLNPYFFEPLSGPDWFYCPPTSAHTPLRLENSDGDWMIVMPMRQC